MIHFFTSDPGAGKIAEDMFGPRIFVRKLAEFVPTSDEFKETMMAILRTVRRSGAARYPMLLHYEQLRFAETRWKDMIYRSGASAKQAIATQYHGVDAQMHSGLLYVENSAAWGHFFHAESAGKIDARGSGLRNPSARFFRGADCGAMSEAVGMWDDSYGELRTAMQKFCNLINDENERYYQECEHAGVQSQNRYTTNVVWRGSPRTRRNVM